VNGPGCSIEPIDLFNDSSTNSKEKAEGSRVVFVLVNQTPPIAPMYTTFPLKFVVTIDIFNQRVVMRNT